MNSPTLTSTEVDIVCMLAAGLSYKEMAWIRKKSRATVKNQLQFLRYKFGARNSIELLGKLGMIKEMRQ